MASKFDQSRGQGQQDCLYDDIFHEPPLSAIWWNDPEEHLDQGQPLWEQVKEMDGHVARLQDMLKYEQVKCSHLQLQCNQQEAELKRRELLTNRLKEKLSQLVDRPRERGLSLEMLNPLPSGKSKREQMSKYVNLTAKREEATLRLMLERREAELREAMKLRHSLTTLLHALRVEMKQSLLDLANLAHGDKNLDQTEIALGEHVTGGIVHSWRQMQKKLQVVLSEGQTAAGTDHDKLLAQLEAELRESQQLVRFQQQLLQDNVASSIPPELSDSYFLEEWERLQLRWTELNQQKRTFEKERQAFTDAAIRLSHERKDFEQQKASFVKQQYLCGSPQHAPTEMPSFHPATPPSSCSDNALVPRIKTPTTPELYAALHMSDGRSREVDQQSEMWVNGMHRRVQTPWAQQVDLSF